MTRCLDETREQCLRRIAEQADANLQDATPYDVIRWAAETFEDRFVVTASMSDAVLAHLTSSVAPGVQVAFLDTGYHFPQTLRTRDRVFSELPVRGITMRPEQTVAEQDQDYGPRLYERDPDRCCDLRKVQPLARALVGFDAWASGIRRDESPGRAGTRVVAYDERRQMVKVSPLATWTRNQVDTYARAHDVPVNPLVQLGFQSIGCAPCTRRVAAGEDPRAGRWAGTEKTECGLHG